MSNIATRTRLLHFLRQTDFWAAVLAVSFLAAVTMRSLRPYWFDELFTLYMTRLPDLPTLWKALTEGADLNPPLYYVGTRLSTALFGMTELGLRVPSVVGYVTMCLSLRVVVERRMGGGWGLVAMLIPMITGPVFYAAEARAYGMMLGLLGLALICWQRRIEGGGPRWVMAMSLLLLATLLIHCYAVLLMFPFWLAELARVLRHRRLDGWMLAGLSLPLLAVVTYLPLMKATSPVAVKNEVFAPTWWSIPLFYNFLLISAVPVLAIAIVGLKLLPRERVTAERRGLLAEEKILAAGLMVVPILAVLLAAVVTQIYLRRYGLGAVCGLGILLPAGLSWWAGRRRFASVVVVVLFACAFVAQAWQWRGEVRYQRGQYRQSLALEHVEPQLPLVIGSGLLYFEIDHYASSTLARRMHYLVDDRLARQWTGTDMFDINFPNLHKWFPIRASLEQAEPYLAQHRRFLLYAYEKHPMDWLPSHLRSRGWSLQQLRRDTDRVLYLAVGPTR